MPKILLRKERSMPLYTRTPHSCKWQNCTIPTQFPVDIKEAFHLYSGLDIVICSLDQCFCLADHKKYSYMYVKLISFILIHSATLQEKKAEEKDGIH